MLTKSLAWISVLFLCSSTYAYVDPGINWKIIETPHFEIIYDANHQSLAYVYAAAAERAHTLLAPLFNNDTPKKTVLVLDDSTDSANGFATPIPRSMIGVYPVLPSAMDFLSYYGDWSQEMITHEYTHILNFEPANGIWAPFRFIFGSIIRPNGLLPRWYLEGLAVRNETQYTAYGRLRSPLYRALIRSQVLDGVWGHEDLGHANEVTIPTWPLGSRPYFYGALVWNDLAQSKDSKIIGRFNERFAGRVPYFLSGPMIDEFNKDFNDFLEDVYKRHQQIAEAQIESLKKSGTTDGTPLFQLQDYFLQHSPRINPQGDRLAFVNRTIEKLDQILIAERKASGPFSTPSLIRTELEQVSKISWFPDGKRIVYDSQDTFDRFYSYNDLYVYDLESKKSKKLTIGARARYPAVSPDGKHISFVRNKASATELVLIDSEGKNERVVHSPALQVRISSPEFIDSSRIIFSEREISGKEYLRELNLETKSIKTVLNEYEPITFAHPTSRGVVFLSTRTGVANLYLASVDFKKVDAITNTTTHIFNGTVDGQTENVIASRLDSRGGHLESLRLSAQKSQLARVDQDDGYKWESYSEPAPYTTSAEGEEYSSLPYMFPQYWLPVIFAGPYGTTFGGSVYGQDPLDKHRYSILGSYDYKTSRPSFGASYVNQQTPVQLAFAGYDSSIYVESLRKRNLEQSIEGSGAFFLPGLSNDWRGLLGWSYYSNKYDDQEKTQLQGPLGGVTYSNITQKGRQISPEEGLSAKALYTQYLDSLSTVGYGRATGSAALYFSKWLPKYNAIKTQVAGSYSQKNRDIYFGTVTGGGEYASSAVTVPFTVRGYAPNEFIGWSILTTLLEYRFPLEYVYKSYGTNPWFLKRTHAALFWDTLTTEGLYYNADTKTMDDTRFGTFYSGVGAEVRFDTTLFYAAPVTFRVGYHYGLTERALGGPGIFLGVLLPEF